MTDVVVIAPHMDDETLGCGGVLALADDPLVVFAVHPTEPDVAIDEVAQLLGFRYTVLYGPEYNARLPSVDRAQLISRLESILHAEKPGQVFIPDRSYHQDHATVHEAGIAATRPMSRNGYLAPFVALYEYPGSVWGPGSCQPALNYFVDTSLVHKRKLAAVAIYELSQRGRDMVTTDVIDAWSQVRGGSVGVSHAEAFRIGRHVVPACE